MVNLAQVIPRFVFVWKRSGFNSRNGLPRCRVVTVRMETKRLSHGAAFPTKKGDSRNNLLIM